MLLALHIVFTALDLCTRSATSVDCVSLSLHALRHQKYYGAVHSVLGLLEGQVCHVPKG